MSLYCPSMSPYSCITILTISHSLKPKKTGKPLPIKRLAVAVISVFLFWWIFVSGNGIFGGESKPDLLTEKGFSTDDSTSSSSSSHKVYKATGNGIDDITTQPDQQQAPMDDEKLYQQTVDFYDLEDYQGSADGSNQGDTVLLLMPLRNAIHVLPMAFHNLMNLTYDHSLIDIAFLVSDCSEGDTTLSQVFEYAVALQNGTLVDMLQHEESIKSSTIKAQRDLYQLYMDEDYMANVQRSSDPKSYHKDYRKPFRLVTIYQKDFGQIIGQGFTDRHAVKVQGIRRKLMGRARNWLTSVLLKPYHSWVYWRDVDIETCPGTVIQDLMKHDYDVMVPNIWRPLPVFLGDEHAQPYDLNTWIESTQALDLAKTLDEDDVIVEGYAEYATWRAHLAYLRDPNGNRDEVIDMDGVGGVSILAKARIFRQGVNFPAFTFLNHAETEAFGKMAKQMGFKVGGLPHYTVWHIYEPSEDDIKKIAKSERIKRRGRRNKVI